MYIEVMIEITVQTRQRLDVIYNIVVKNGNKMDFD